MTDRDCVAVARLCDDFYRAFGSPRQLQGCVRIRSELRWCSDISHKRLVRYLQSARDRLDRRRAAALGRGRATAGDPGPLSRSGDGRPGAGSGGVCPGTVGARGGSHRGAEGPFGALGPRSAAALARELWSPRTRSGPRFRPWKRKEPCCAAPSPGVRSSRGRDRVVRPAPLGAHPPLHRGSATPRDRAGLGRRPHALPVRLAVCERRQPLQRRGGPAGRPGAAGVLRGAATSVGGGPRSGAPFGLRPRLARPPLPVRPGSMATADAVHARRRHDGRCAWRRSRSCGALPPRFDLRRRPKRSRPPRQAPSLDRPPAPLAGEGRRWRDGARQGGALEGYALLKVSGKGTGLDALRQGMSARFTRKAKIKALPAVE